MPVTCNHHSLLLHFRVLCLSAELSLACDACKDRQIFEQLKDRQDSQQINTLSAGTRSVSKSTARMRDVIATTPPAQHTPCCEFGSSHHGELVQFSNSGKLHCEEHY
jgi:hypothetical protein